MTPPGLRRVRTSRRRRGSVLTLLLVATTALVLGIPDLPARANPVPAPPEWLPVTFEGTMVDRQRGLYACGRVAVAGWVSLRVERVERGSLATGTLVRAVVGCPEMLRPGHRYHVEADRHGPRLGRWRSYSIQRPIPAGATPTIWTTRIRAAR